MHEQKIGRAIVDKALKAGAEGGGTVTKIIVECGELSHLPAQDMEAVLRGLVPAGTEVVVTSRGATVKCRGCGFEGPPRIELHSHDANIFFCKGCGGVPEILEGGDITLKGIEIEEFG